MNFELTNEQKDIQKLAWDFAEKELLPQVRERDESGEFPLEAFRKLGKTGIYGLPYPKELGGMGGSYLSYILAVEEISKVDAAFGIAFSVDTSLYGGSIMNSSAPDEIKKKFLAPITYGEKIGSFGLTEHSAGSDAAGQHTVATKDGDSYVINGSKCFITNGNVASTFVVFAMTDKSKGNHGISAFIVESTFPGFSTGKHEKKMGIRGSSTCDLIFEDCIVPKENLLGELNKGFQIAMMTLDGGRIGIAAQALGIAQGAIDETVKYVKDRVQFGRPISKFQNTQFMLAEMQTRVDAARMLVYRAAAIKDAGEPYSSEAAMAKLFASETAREVTWRAVQLFGGYGYTRDYPVERMMRDAKITEIYEGTSEVQKMVISSRMGL